MRWSAIVDSRIQVDVVYTTSMNRLPEVIIELYHDHAASEQYHCKIRPWVASLRLFCHQSAGVMYLAMLAFNLLCPMGQESLDYQGTPIKNRNRNRHRRLRSVIQGLIYLAVQLIRHVRWGSLGFGQTSPLYHIFAHLYYHLCPFVLPVG